MSKTRRRTFFRHTPTCKAAEAAELDAAVAAWTSKGGQVVTCPPLEGPDLQEWWEGLRAPTSSPEDVVLDSTYVGEDPEEGPAPWGEIPW